MRDGKVVVNGKNVDEPEVTHDEERENAVHLVDMNINNAPNIEKDDQLAIAFNGVWFPGQFREYEKENEEIEVHFLERSSSTNNRFVWPELSGKKEDISWVDEGDIIFR